MNKKMSLKSKLFTPLAAVVLALGGLVVSGFQIEAQAAKSEKNQELPPGMVKGQVVAVEEDHIKVRYKDQKSQTKTMELTREFFADEDLRPGISEILVDLGNGSEQSWAR